MQLLPSPPKAHHLSSVSQVTLDAPKESVRAIVVQSDHVAPPVDLDTHGWPHLLDRGDKILRLIRITTCGENHEVVEGHRSDENLASHITRPICLVRLVVNLMEEGLDISRKTAEPL